MNIPNISLKSFWDISHRWDGNKGQVYIHEDATTKTHSLWRANYHTVFKFRNNERIGAADNYKVRQAFQNSLLSKNIPSDLKDEIVERLGVGKYDETNCPELERREIKDILHKVVGRKRLSAIFAGAPRGESSKADTLAEEVLNRILDDPKQFPERPDKGADPVVQRTIAKIALSRTYEKLRANTNLKEGNAGRGDNPTPYVPLDAPELRRVLKEEYKSAWENLNGPLAAIVQNERQHGLGDGEIACLVNLIGVFDCKTEADLNLALTIAKKAREVVKTLGNPADNDEAKASDRACYYYLLKDMFGEKDTIDWTCGGDRLRLGVKLRELFHQPRTMIRNIDELANLFAPQKEGAESKVEAMLTKMLDGTDPAYKIKRGSSQESEVVDKAMRNIAVMRTYMKLYEEMNSPDNALMTVERLKTVLKEEYTSVRKDLRVALKEEIGDNENASRYGRLLGAFGCETKDDIDEAIELIDEARGSMAIYSSIGDEGFNFQNNVNLLHLALRAKYPGHINEIPLSPANLPKMMKQFQALVRAKQENVGEIPGEQPVVQNREQPVVQNPKVLDSKAIGEMFTVNKEMGCTAGDLLAEMIAGNEIGLAPDIKMSEVVDKTVRNIAVVRTFDRIRKEMNSPNNEPMTVERMKRFLKEEYKNASEVFHGRLEEFMRGENDKSLYSRFLGVFCCATVEELDVAIKLIKEAKDKSLFLQDQYRVTLDISNFESQLKNLRTTLGQAYPEIFAKMSADDSNLLTQDDLPTQMRVLNGLVREKLKPIEPEIMFDKVPDKALTMQDKLNLLQKKMSEAKNMLLKEFDLAETKYKRETGDGTKQHTGRAMFNIAFSRTLDVFYEKILKSDGGEMGLPTNAQLKEVFNAQCEVVRGFADSIYGFVKRGLSKFGNEVGAFLGVFGCATEADVKAAEDILLECYEKDKRFVANDLSNAVAAIYNHLKTQPEFTKINGGNDLGDRPETEKELSKAHAIREFFRKNVRGLVNLDIKEAVKTFKNGAKGQTEVEAFLGEVGAKMRDRLGKDKLDKNDWEEIGDAIGILLRENQGFREAVFGIDPRIIQEKGRLGNEDSQNIGLCIWKKLSDDFDLLEKYFDARYPGLKDSLKEIGGIGIPYAMSSPKMIDLLEDYNVIDPAKQAQFKDDLKNALTKGLFNRGGGSRYSLVEENILLHNGFDAGAIGRLIQSDGQIPMINGSRDYLNPTEEDEKPSGDKLVESLVTELTKQDKTRAPKVRALCRTLKKEFGGMSDADWMIGVVCALMNPDFVSGQFKMLKPDENLYKADNGNHKGKKAVDGLGADVDFDKSRQVFRPREIRVDKATDDVTLVVDVGYEVPVVGEKGGYLSMPSPTRLEFVVSRGKVSQGRMGKPTVEVKSIEKA